MRLLIRTLGRGPVPYEVDADADGTQADFQKLIASSCKLPEPSEGQQHKLVYRGRMLRDGGAKLRDLCCEGDVIVVLPARAPLPHSPPAPPSRGPGMREINAAIREDLARQGPATLAAAEAAARRQAAQQQQQAQDEGMPQLLEEALMGGDMAALRTYLQQLRAALQGPGEAAAEGGGGSGGADGSLPAAALDAAAAALFGLPLTNAQLGGTGGSAGGGAPRPGAAGQAAALGHADSGDEWSTGDEGEEDEQEEESEGSFEGEAEHDEEHGSVGTSEQGSGSYLLTDEEGHSEGFEGVEGHTDSEQEEGEGEHEEAQGMRGFGARPAGGRRPGGQPLPPQVPEPDPAALAEFQEMGFPEQLCRNALLMGRNRFQPALEWLLAHAEDPDAAQPLSDAQLVQLYGRGAVRRGPEVDQGHLAHLLDMGFDRHHAEQALRACHNSLPAACQWLLTVGPAATAPVAAEPGRGGGAGVAAAPGAAAGEGGAGPSMQQPSQQQQPGTEQASAADWAPGAAGQLQSSEGDGHSARSSSSGSEAGDREAPAGQGAMPGLVSGSESGSEVLDSDEEEQRRQHQQRQYD